MTATFVMCLITATFARFTTCSRHLNEKKKTVISETISEKKLRNRYLWELVLFGISLEVVLAMLILDCLTASGVV
jgi:hypothetical protein